ncbi:nucleoside hydrolase [Larkinella bovis]|uniref:Nucleoside hydrolase n=1 Tax=Larkinella bovis TaxID=683041 RepID=A0ABW0IBI0_9BACT
MKPVSIILDTDMGADYDDAGALATLHALEDLGEARILAVGASNQLPYSVPLIEVINRYYGKPAIPVGAVKGKAATIDTWHKGEKWTHELPIHYFHAVPTTRDAPDAITVFRSVLAAQPDQSVVLVTIGFFTNLGHLLDSPPDKFSPLTGKQLVQKKVVRVVSMAGKFPSGKETNVIVDPENARKVFAEWPGEMVISGYEIGRFVRTGDRLIQMPVTKNPVKDAYAMSIAQDKLETDNSRYEPGGRASYDQTAVLAAVRTPETYFGLERGTFVVQNDGSNTWHPNATGTHWRLLEKTKPQALAGVIEDLMMKAPASRNP